MAGRTSRRFRILEHTADVGFEARGADAAEAFAAAAEALYSIICYRRRIRERIRRDISLPGRADAEDLLVDWLSELLFVTEVEGLVFRRFEMHEVSAKRLRATAIGEPFDEQRHPKGTVVKGVTRHRLFVGAAKGGYRVRAILDI